MINIAIADRQNLEKIDRPQIRRIVRAVLKEEGITAADISVAFVADTEMARLNERFLRHRGATDVIAFPLSEPEEAILNGEIVVSVETAGIVARKYGHTVAQEMGLYVIHGVLHLCGYDDHSPKD